jgi:hypothetical protein
MQKTINEELPNKEEIQDSSHTTDLPKTRIVLYLDSITGGNKRVHESYNLDKEKILVAPSATPTIDLQLTLLNSSPTSWTNFKNKEEKNGRIEDYLNS